MGRSKDPGNCRHCGVRLPYRGVALKHGKGIWLCEPCYVAVRDAVDEALATGVQDAPERPS